MKYIKLAKDLTPEQLDKMYWEQIEKYGAPIATILEEEAKKFEMSIDEFLVSEKSMKRVQELEEVFGVLFEIEPGMKELSGGAPGSGKRR
mgnify:CR=1 FL=1